MLTRLVIRNLKRFDEAEIELGPRVVLVGPNNCGKTTALQALSLWHLAVQRWSARFPDGNPPPQRPGVVLGRADLVATPVPKANQLWRAAKVGSFARPGGKRTLDRTHIEIGVSGVEADGTEWDCAFELDYANPESLNCRPRRLHADGEPPRWSAVPPAARAQRVAFLPPMSGLADREFRKEQGEVDFLIGQGRTAEVLRNLCQMVSLRDQAAWDRVVQRMKRLFGVEVLTPTIGGRADLVVEYEERGVKLDLACAGRGMQQTLLLLTYMELNRGSVLLLDEPDAHLEVLRQAQIYEELSGHAEETGSQIVAATHSEKLLNEAASRDIVVAFTGRPHRVGGNKSQVLKSLQSIGFDHFLSAEQRGWVLYLEGSTDLSFLRSFAARLGHPAARVLERPYVHYVSNQPRTAQEHFHAVQDAFPGLLGLGVFDRLEKPLPPSHPNLQLRCWSVYEVENHVCTREVLRRWVRAEADKMPVLRHAWPDAMESVLDEVERAWETLGQPAWSIDIKASEAVLPNIFQRFHQRVSARDLTSKADYHTLVQFTDPSELRAEVTEILDLVLRVAENAQPRGLE